MIYMIENFLTHHKRGCPAIKGQDCNCGLFIARAELDALKHNCAKLAQAAREVLEHYDVTDDEFSDSFYVDRQYRILNIDPDTEEWYALLTKKQIVKRKFTALLARDEKRIAP